MLKLPQVVTIVFICTLIAGCARFDSSNFSRMFRSLSPALQAEHNEQVRDQSRQLLEAGNATDALKLLNHEFANGTDPSVFTAIYPRSINLLLIQANNHLENSQYLPAGKKYRLALSHYPTTRALQEKIMSDPAAIEHYIDLCASKLLESGLVAYRSGQLQEALDVWTQIRIFHPSYAPSHLAIETTRIQLKNLENLPGNPG